MTVPQACRAHPAPVAGATLLPVRRLRREGEVVVEELPELRHHVRQLTTVDSHVAMESTHKSASLFCLSGGQRSHNDRINHLALTALGLGNGFAGLGLRQKLPPKSMRLLTSALKRSAGSVWATNQNGGHVWTPDAHRPDSCYSPQILLLEFLCHQRSRRSGTAQKVWCWRPREDCSGYCTGPTWS